MANKLLFSFMRLIVKLVEARSSTRVSITNAKGGAPESV